MFRPRVCLCILCPLIGLALVLFLLLAPAQPDARAQDAGAGKQRVSFINNVAPILKDNCFACHDAKKKKGKLDMTTFENFRKGGSRDDPIEAGKPEESVLIDMLSRPGDNRMPPKEAGAALPKTKIDVISQWIKEGAKLDAGLDPKADLFRELRVRWEPPAPPAVYKVPVAVTALTFTPDNKALVVGGYHELTVWDIETTKLIKRIRTRAERAYALAYLPDGKLVVAGGRPGQEGDVRVYDLDAQTGKTANGVSFLDGVHDRSVLVAQLLDCDDSVLALALSHDGKYLAAAGCDRLVRVWDVSAGGAKARLEQSIANHADWVLGLAFSPDGKYLLSASRDNTAKIWDLAARTSVATFLGHQNVVYGVAQGWDGTQAISVGEDGALRIWQAKDQERKLDKEGKVDKGVKTAGNQLKAGKGGHTKAVLQLVVQVDLEKPLVATSSADGTVKLWDLAAGSATRTLTGLSDYVYALAISPNGTMMAAGSWNGEVMIWEVSDGRMLRGFTASAGYVAAKE